jgi:hypothetical protein
MRRISTLAVALAACADPGRSVLIPPEGSQAAIVFFHFGDEIEAFAFRMSDGPPVSSALLPEPGLVVTALFYREPLSDLSIVAGPLARGSGRKLPPATAGVLESTSGSGELGPWIELPSIPTELQSFELDPVPARDCVLRGGCLDDGECKIPCTPPPEVRETIPPAPPIEPDLRPCPEGWVEEGRECKPALEAALAPCPNGEVPFASGCRALGSCPDDGWPVAIPAAVQVLYVKANASPGGVGTRTDPFDTIASAIARSAAGTVIVISGTITEHVELPADTTLLGSCPLDSVIVAPAGASEAVRAGERTMLKDLGLEGGLKVETESVDIERIRFSARGRIGLEVEGGAITAREIAIEGSSEVAIRLAGGARATIESSSILRGARGIELSDSEASLDDVAIRAQPTTTGTAALVHGGGSLRLDRVLISGGAGHALSIVETSSCSGSDLVIAGFGGSGISLRDASHLDLRRVRVERSRGHGVRIEGGARARLADVVVREISGSDTSDSKDGSAFVVRTATLSAERALIENYGKFGVYGLGPAATVHLTDARFIGPGLIGPPVETGGVLLERGAAATIERVRLDGSGAKHVYVRDGTLTARDVRLVEGRDTTGIVVEGTGTILAERVDMKGDLAVGFRIGGTGQPGITTGIVRDLRIEGARDGIILKQSLELTIERLAFRSLTTIGLNVGGGATVSVSDASFGLPSASGTSPRAGVVILDNGSADLRRFVIEGYATGATITSLGALDLHEGRIAAEMTVFDCAGHDLARLVDRVLVDLTKGQLGCEP